jgi:addiction module RelE/StbE family toxin
VKVVWTPAAVRDVEAISEFIAQDNPVAAMLILHRIRERARALADNPLVGRSGRVRGTRELVVSGTSYIIVYRIQEERVDLLKVLHGAQRWPDRF